MYTTFGTGVRIASGIVATKILSVYLSSHDLGITILVELIARFLEMVSGFRIGTAALRSITQAEGEEQNIVVDTVVIFRLLTVVLVALLFLVTQRWIYGLFGEQPVEGLTPLILVFALALAYQTVLKKMLQGFFRFKQMALIDLVTGILQMVLLIVFLVWFKAGMAGAVLAQVIAIAVAGLLFYLYLPTKKGVSFRATTLHQLLRFSWPLQINAILTFIFGSFGTLVVATVMTPSDVALLGIATKIPSKIRQLYESVRTVYFPNLSALLAQDDWRRGRRMMNAMLRTVAFLMTLSSMLVLVFQKEIILLFYSEQYLEVGPVFALAMLSTAINLVGDVLGTSAVAAGNSKAPPVSNTVNTIATVLGNLALVPPFGILGATLAGMVGCIVTNPVNVWFLHKTNLVPRVMNYVKPFLVFGALYGIFWWLRPESWLARLPFLLAFVVASFSFSIITFKDIRTIWDSLEWLWGKRIRGLVRR